jgi:hypothetical protein
MPGWPMFPGERGSHRTNFFRTSSSRDRTLRPGNRARRTATPGRPCPVGNGTLSDGPASAIAQGDVALIIRGQAMGVEVPHQIATHAYPQCSIRRQDSATDSSAVLSIRREALSRNARRIKGVNPTSRYEQDAANYRATLPQIVAASPGSTVSAFSPSTGTLSELLSVPPREGTTPCHPKPWPFVCCKSAGRRALRPCPWRGTPFSPERRRRSPSILGGIWRGHSRDDTPDDG